jgi:hypothetical protein
MFVEVKVTQSLVIFCFAGKRTFPVYVAKKASTEQRANTEPHW